MRPAPPHRRRRSTVGAVVPGLVIVAVAAMTVAGLAMRPADPGTGEQAAHVVVAGAAGLRWGDLDPERTPHLWQLASDGAVGSISVRSANRPTCAGDGWLTLGAGNWAAETTRPAADGCRPLGVVIEPTGAAGAYLPGQEALVRANRWHLPWGAVPGALAGSVDCSTAVGPGAAVAAARVYGRVDRYEPRPPADPVLFRELLQRCELGIVDLGTVAGEGAQRESAAAAVDAELGAVLAARPPASLLLVAGVAGTGPDPRLHVAVADGPGFGGGMLTSNTTRRTGYLQLVDVAPTVLAAVGRPMPEVRLAGSPARQVPVRAGSLADDVARLVAADEGAGRAQPVRGWFLIGVVTLQLALLAAVVPLLRRHRTSPVAGGRADEQARAGRSGARPDRRHPVPVLLRHHLVPVLLVAASLMLPAALVASGLPWWRADRSELVFVLAVLAVLAAATVLVVRSRLFPRTLALVAVCAGVAAVTVAADLLSGARLQLNGVIGYSAHDGDRFAGVGPIGAGMLVAGSLLVAGVLAQQVPPRWRAAVVAVAGGAAVVLLGNIHLGSELGAAVGLIAGVCLTAAMCTGGWLTATRVVWAGGVGLAMVAALALIDLQRVEQERGGLGRLFTELADGTAGFGLQRMSLTNGEALASSPLNLLALGAALFFWLVLLRPSGGLKRLFGIYPALRASMGGTVAASIVAGVITGQALIVAGAAASVALPLVTLAARRVRELPVRSGASTYASPDQRASVLG
jgi:hypothetical protein